MNFWNFFTIHVFEAGKLISDIPLSYHVRVTSKIQVNFPVQEVLESTDDWVL